MAPSSCLSPERQPPPKAERRIAGQPWASESEELKQLFIRLWPVLTIALASGLLLYSDLGHREAARPTAKLPRLVIMQWASTDLLDHVVEGIVEGLRQRGYEDGKTATIKFLNASGDNATGNLMARSVVGGDYDLVLTASTLAMQAVAAANREGRVSHLFGGVTDPYGAGVGITGPEPTQHPPHLAGVGTFQPVDGAIRVARQMNPALRKIGVVWNPGEDNSAACLKVARATCAELEIELLEANAGTTTEVPEAIRSILSRGVTPSGWAEIPWPSPLSAPSPRPPSRPAGPFSAMTPAMPGAGPCSASARPIATSALPWAIWRVKYCGGAAPLTSAWPTWCPRCWPSIQR